MEQMRADFADAPRAIQNIADELSAYKAKVKAVTHQHTSDERLIHSQNEKLHHLSEQLKEANTIIESKDLRTIDTLRTELEAMRARLAENEKQTGAELKNLALQGRNASVEAQKLRARVQELQTEKTQWQDQATQLEVAIKVCPILFLDPRMAILVND